MKLRKVWHSVQTAAGLGTALVILLYMTPLASGLTAPAKMTGIAPISQPSVNRTSALDGKALPAPPKKTRAHEPHIIDPQ